MTELSDLFVPPSLQNQPATRKKLAYSGLLLMITIGCAVAVAYLSDIAQSVNPPAINSSLHIMAVAACAIGLALMINVFIKYAELAEDQLQRELDALPDAQLILCGQLKNCVPEDEWRIIRSALGERWVDWDVRLADLQRSEEKS